MMKKLVGSRTPEVNIYLEQSPHFLLHAIVSWHGQGAKSKPIDGFFFAPAVQGTRTDGRVKCITSHGAST